ncbi:calcium-binding protein [Nocardioides humilatus]|uniref:Calcium-binding protein n=1 Tax=Nocardioides humilatus TaxID=2607660 RepID=A0A5B1LIL9_9ACTN|nr:calcium-binding protein [Nocardioides humilatus]KAA1420234.1 calcium-binding protein [Nocardioides humilatus]
MSTSVRRRAAATLLAVAGLVVIPAFVPAAAGQSGQADQPAPDAGPAVPDCDLGAAQSPRDELVGCTDVVLTFDSAPDVGATTTVDVAVTSAKEIRGAELTLRANSGFALTGTPGFADRGAQESGVGPMTAVARSIDLAADRTVHFSVTVTGAKAGLGVLQARLDTTGGAFDGGDELSVRLGRRTDLTTPRRPRLIPSREPVQLATQQTGLAPYHRAPLRGRRALDPGTPGASCSSGRITYADELGEAQVSANLTLQIWDADDDSADDDLLAETLTDADGAFDLCFESTDDEGGGQEIYIAIRTENGAWRIRDTPSSNATYVLTSSSVGINDPATFDWGDFLVDNDYGRLLHAFASLNLLYNWQFDVSGGYLDNAGDTRQMVANWTPTSTDGTYYDVAANDIHLVADDPDADYLTISEAAKALMDALYDDAYPATPNCSRNFLTSTSTGCAWTRGWADWVAARVLDDPYLRYSNGNSYGLEAQGWGDFYIDYGVQGDTFEYRVAGALIDLSDSTNENYWDRHGEGGATASTEEIYTSAAQREVSDTLFDYFTNDRVGEGDTGYYARASLFQNTIDYTHRDPLVSGEPLTRPGAPPAPSGLAYSYEAQASFWGGVAVRPAGLYDFDLSLYSDEAQTDLLALSSIATTGVIDYVVVDGHHSTGDFYPYVQDFSFAGPYRIEEMTGSVALALGTTQLSFLGKEVLQVLDVGADAGVVQYIGVRPDPSLDVSILAHVSDPSNATTWAQPRNSRVAGADNLSAGQRGFLTYSVPTADQTGLVVLNESGTAASYTLYRDTAGPGSPTVLADGGNPSTYDTSVDLALSASASNGAGSTPLYQMQISTDGAFDSEPWVDYATTGTATLPAGLGSKTVSVRYRNAAGAISATATDTINVVATPMCNSLTPTVAGFGTVTGTAGSDVIVGGPGADVISGLGGNDTICGLGGNDSVNDGPGADTVFGDNGNDVVKQPATGDAGDVFDGGAGIDQVSYGARSGNITVTLDANADDGLAGEGDLVQTTIENVTTGGGNDTLLGTSAANRLIGNGGADIIIGAGGNDYLTGNGGVDTLRGGDGNDTILAGDGDDTIEEGTTANGTDLIKGGTGSDLVTYENRSLGVAIRLNGVPTSGASGENDKILNCEHALGGAGNDTLVGHVTADTLSGAGGNDTITGNGNADALTGGPGADVLNGGNGNDNLTTTDGVNGNDTANGGAGSDTATTDPGDIRISIP